ncbi:MAG: hypothetical protein PSX80_16845 [bacterium]|nr:hypothetical protein [bacterium]
MEKLFLSLRQLSILCVIALLFVTPETASGQSVDEAHPTGVAAFPLTGNLGPGTYYYSVPVAPGRVSVSLTFKPPSGGGSMSVSISGPACCGADAYVGGDSGTSDDVQRNASFVVPTAQKLLLTVYISVERTQTIRFDLGLKGSLSESAPPSVCTDLEVSNMIGVSRSGTTLTIRGNIDNFSKNDFRSPVDRQWVEISTGAKESFVSLARIPFAQLLAGRSLRVTATHTSTMRATPRFTIRIVYSPLNASDALATNDDCNSANDSVSGSGLIRGIPLTKTNKGSDPK